MSHGARTERAAAEGNAVISPDAISSDILGIEIGSSTVRAVLVDRKTREIVAAAECGVLSMSDPQSSGGLDSRAISPAVDDVLYQLGVDDRSQLVAAVSIGPEYSGVGSGPALPAWLDHQARQLGENLVCAGHLGVAFCPQRPIDTVISICEQADITVARIDLAPVAAARLLAPGSADTITMGSDRGWRARLRDDEVLEALQNPEIDPDQPMAIIAPDGLQISVEQYHDVSVAFALAETYDLNLGQLAPAVGAAIGYIDSSPSNLLDGETITGREEVVTAVGSSAAHGSADTSRTTIDLQRASARTVMAPGSSTSATEVLDESNGLGEGGGPDEGVGSDVATLDGADAAYARSQADIDLTRFDDQIDEAELAADDSADYRVPDRETGPMLIEHPMGGRFGRSRSGHGGATDDAIAIFSPDPESERKLIDDGRRVPVSLIVLLAVIIVAVVVYFLVLS
jgi:hypothetical protein